MMRYNDFETDQEYADWLNREDADPQDVFDALCEKLRWDALIVRFHTKHFLEDYTEFEARKPNSNEHRLWRVLPDGNRESCLVGYWRNDED